MPNKDAVLHSRIACCHLQGGLGHGGSTVNDNNYDNARGKFESDDDGNARVAAALTLLDFWWRALEVSTEAIANAMDALLGVHAWKGLDNACRMRGF
jgi:hypothetical protein